MTLITRLAKKPATIATTQHKIRSLAPRLRALSLIVHLSPLGIGAVANYRQLAPSAHETRRPDGSPKGLCKSHIISFGRQRRPKRFACTYSGAAPEIEIGDGFCFSHTRRFSALAFPFFGSIFSS
jgi:hypothetical protein